MIMWNQGGKYNWEMEKDLRNDNDKDFKERKS